ncbi:hypothetical protein EJ05DRAFT_502930 [Pseudovirgaria hyperparasitica]|uniref:Uncharacterized protein n=1 Tax=Pseudovirgaria hyperparasitica TaxID=470096 RepID=A0A6A6W354_9PEZI|nr:uncharacterized protein EJ05DRAFT_502930 [Pseudovirgaria hyperparasitica]KAF2755471.1 hypothetical protein EJ05DRAFT_502930 [Pseudovirgaria hyperparasitica]
MTDQADLQVVGRDALRSAESSRSPSPDHDNCATNTFRELLNKRFGAIEDIEILDTPPAFSAVDVGDDIEDTELRLFASQSAPTKIDLRSPSPPGGEPGFVQPERPLSYYLAESPSAQDQIRLALAAVSGEEVLDRSHARWAGCALPWRVHTVIPETILGTKIHMSELQRRRRPSKKARIALRAKQKAKLMKEEEAKRAAQEKEQYLREKKSAENRKKQLKKRAKERAKKAETGIAARDISMSAD